MVQVRLLGEVTAVGDDGDRLDVGPAKCRAVLATLALSVGEAVPVSHLIDVLWPDDPPRTADKTLQGYVAQLRRALGHGAIVRTGAAYRLELDREQVDVARFRRLLSAGDVDTALETWTGEPLAGLDVPGLGPAVDGLVEQWLSGVEHRLGRRVSSDPAGAVGPLTELAAAHPLREELWALLMTALYRSGRQADALAAFRRARDHLVEELGVEPGPRLRELEAQILAHDEGLQATVAARAPEQPEPQSGRPTGTVTFGFAEVSDASRLWAEHRRKMVLAMARLDTVVRTVTSRHGGTIVVSAGESIGAAFHRGDDAAAWAIELQVAVDQEPWPGGVGLRLQVALHTGETREHRGGYFGPAVHTASRLAAAAHAGQILVSGVTAGLLERNDLRDLGTHRLDGMVGDFDLWQLDEHDHPLLRTASQRGNVPGRSVRLIGREAELEDVADAIESSPVVTLVGPGGVGKTTLALASARRSAADSGRRVWLVELAEIATSAEVPHRIAETLGVTGGGGRTVTESVVAALRSRPTLLVLDNCEHVVEGAAAIAQLVADAGAGTRVLATSREALAIPAEQAVPVAPLDPAAAVELFADRARAAGRALELDGERAEVEEICRRLDGLPLAIELAAARSATLTPGQLLSRIDDRLRLLGGGRRAGAARHQTLRATVQWSYDLLSRPQQLMFERLAVFAGPFDLTAAEAVAAGDESDAVDADRLLADLVDRSMVGVEPGPFGRRFRLLETLRQFALDQLARHGEQDQVKARHARWCRHEVRDIGTLLTGHGEVEGVARLLELWPNLRAAVDWACATGDVDLADALVRPVASEVSLRRQVEIAEWAERILDLTAPEDESRTVFWLLWAGHRHAQAGDRRAYDELVRRHGHGDHPVVRFNDAYMSQTGQDPAAVSTPAIAWLRDEGERHAADMLEVSGTASSLMVLRRFDELDTLAARMEERHRAHGPPTLRYFALGLRGYAAQYQGRHDDAVRFFDVAEHMELPRGTYRVLQTARARIAFEQGQRSRAYRMLRDNIDVLLDSDYTDVTRMVAVEFITMMAATDHLPQAAHVLPYLDTTGDFARLARESLIADAVHRIAADPEIPDDAGGDADPRAALTFMRDVLHDLISRSQR